MKNQNHYSFKFLLAIAAFLFLALSPAALAQAPSLGTASGFAALGGTAVTCTDSDITGNVGVVTAGGFTNTRCLFAGSINVGDATAAQAYSDFLSAYASLANTPCGPTPPLTGTLAGVTLTPGVYCFTAAAALTGTLTLDAQGDPNAVFIFKIGTGGTGALTGTSFSVVLANGAAPCNVFWWVSQAATMTTSNFQGVILAGADITVTGGTFNGDALAGGTGSTSAPTGAVTLTGSTSISCAGGTGGHLRKRCNQGVGNGPEGCDPGNSNNHNSSNDENGGTPGDPGRQGKK